MCPAATFAWPGLPASLLKMFHPLHPGRTLATENVHGAMLLVSNLPSMLCHLTPKSRSSCTNMTFFTPFAWGSFETLLLQQYSFTFGGTTLVHRGPLGTNLKEHMDISSCGYQQQGRQLHFGVLRPSCSSIPTRSLIPGPMWREVTVPFWSNGLQLWRWGWSMTDPRPRSFRSCKRSWRHPGWEPHSTNTFVSTPCFKLPTVLRWCMNLANLTSMATFYWPNGVSKINIASMPSSQRCTSWSTCCWMWKTSWIDMILWFAARCSGTVVKTKMQLAVCVDWAVVWMEEWYQPECSPITWSRLAYSVTESFIAELQAKKQSRWCPVKLGWCIFLRVSSFWIFHLPHYVSWMICYKITRWNGQINIASMPFAVEWFVTRLQDMEWSNQTAAEHQAAII